MQVQPLAANAPGAELRRIAMEYNWDDGFELPHAIADHANCDLAVALELFWLAEAADVYLKTASVNPHNEPWRTFSSLVAKRIAQGYYKGASTRFEVPLTKVQVYNYRKQGLPEVFLSNVEPTQA